MAARWRRRLGRLLVRVRFQAIVRHGYIALVHAQAIKLECCQTLLRHVSDIASKQTAQCPAATLWCVAQVRSNRAARIVAGVNVYGAVQTGMEIKEWHAWPLCVHARSWINRYVV